MKLANEYGLDITSCKIGQMAVDFKETPSMTTVKALRLIREEVQKENECVEKILDEYLSSGKTLETMKAK